METSLGINQAMISLETTPLTSIENRTGIVEKDPLSAEDFKQAKSCQLNRSKTSDGRYSVSSSSSLIKNNFYAIHHSFKFNENNDPHLVHHHHQQQQEKLTASSPSSSPSSSSPISTAKVTCTPNEVSLPPQPTTPQQVLTPPTTTTTTTTTDSTNQISRKRQTPDPTTETTTSEIIQAVSPTTTTATELNDSNNNNNSKRKKIRPVVKHRKLLDSHSSTNNNTSQESYCLFKSCSSIWPGSSHSLGEFSHQNITELSNLLKIRLCQAKFKMMATLDQDDDLFDFLNDEYVVPQPKVHHIITLPTTHHQSTMSVIGNGKNLFRRYNKKHQNGNGSNHNNTNSNNQKTSSATVGLSSSIASLKENDDHNNNSTGKKQKQNSQSGKTKRISKRKSVACEVPSVVLSDGTRVYVCEPCGKKYKNRNGLTYHLERCKNKVKKEETNKLNCICTQPPQQESPSLIQCEKCRSLLHTECMGLTADVATHHDFICPHCKADPKQQQEEVNTQKTASTTISKPSPLVDDLHMMGDEENNDTQNDNGTNKDINSIIHHGGNNNNDNEPNSALHVWDDFSFSSAIDKVFEPWSMLSEEEPFSSQYDSSDIQTQWNMNNLLNQPPSLLFSDATLSSTLEDDSVMLHSELTPAPVSEHTPPTTTSALMPETPTNTTTTTAITHNNNNNSSDHNDSNNNVNTPTQQQATPTTTATTTSTTTTMTDGLWFQFANFDDDYQCE